MAKAPEYVKFKERDSQSGKTKVVEVRTARNNAWLGEISWYGPWRRYVFHPRSDCVFDVGCLSTIISKLTRLQQQHVQNQKEQP